MKTGEVCYAHIRGTHMDRRKNRQHVAITLAMLAQDEEPGTLMVKAGFAFCSPRDQFSRARGRTVALGRLLCGGRYTSTVWVSADWSRIALLDSLLSRVRDVPTWASGLVVVPNFDTGVPVLVDGG